jgi:integrase
MGDNMKIYRRKGRRGLYVWYVDKYPYVKGQGRRESLQTTSKKIATQKKEAMERELYENMILKKEQRKKVKFSSLCQKYLLYCKDNNQESTYRRKKGIIRNHLLQVFKSKTIDDISIYDIEIYKKKRRKRVTPASVNRELACLKHMFSMALLWGDLSVNNIRLIKNFKEPPGRMRYLMEDEEDLLLSESSSYLKLIVVFAIETGMRKGEILNLQWSAVDLVNGMIRIEKTKNNEGRIIPISNRLYDTLIGMGPIVGNQYVFAHDNGRRYRDIKDGFANACKRAGIQDFRFHDLRHTFATRLLMKGVDSRIIQVLLGQKSQVMTARYTHIPLITLRQAVDRLQNSEYNESGVWHTFGTQGFRKKCVPAKR